jgi:Fe-S-cluster containining protein
MNQDFECPRCGHCCQSEVEWVGLTDDEIKSVCYKRDWTAPWTNTDFARAIEEKLKEKNT